MKSNPRKSLHPALETIALYSRGDLPVAAAVAHAASYRQLRDMRAAVIAVSIGSRGTEA